MKPEEIVLIARVLQALAAVAGALFAGVGLVFVLFQIRAVWLQLRAGNVAHLYTQLDTEAAREGRDFIYKEFGTLSNPSPEQVKVVRDVLAALDRMSYQVIRRIADRRAAYDLYGRVLLRVMVATWDWLQRDRHQRRDLQSYRYCRFAEALAMQFARKTLRELNVSRRLYRHLEPKQLLIFALNSTLELVASQPASIPSAATHSHENA